VYSTVAGVLAALSTVVTAPTVAGPPVGYVALGDSYAAGLGARDYLDDSGSCARRAHAYPARWAAGHGPAACRSVAGSGATAGSVVDAQVSALSGATTLVSVTVGGNDVGFSTTMRTCLTRGSDECVAAARAGGDRARTRLPGLLDTVYAAIAQRAPRARVVVVGYPRLYRPGGSCSELSEAARTEINAATDTVDEVTAAAAARHGFAFADVRPAFTGHQRCDGDPWIHGWSPADVRESYHPTPDGQAEGYYPAFAASAASPASPSARAAGRSLRRNRPRHANGWPSQPSS